MNIFILSSRNKKDEKDFLFKQHKTFYEVPDFRKNPDLNKKDVK